MGKLQQKPGIWRKPRKEGRESGCNARGRKRKWREGKRKVGRRRGRKGKAEDIRMEI